MRKSLIIGVSIVAVAAAVLAAGAAVFLQPGQTLTVEAAHRRAAAGELLLIDVREPGEWRATGIPAAAKALSMRQGGTAFVRSVLSLAGHDKTRPIALICARGVRSARMQAVLEKAGFTHVWDVAGGVSGGIFGARGWLSANLPVRKAPETASGGVVAGQR